MFSKKHFNQSKHGPSQSGDRHEKHKLALQNARQSMIKELEQFLNQSLPPDKGSDSRHVGSTAGRGR